MNEKYLLTNILSKLPKPPFLIAIQPPKPQTQNQSIKSSLLSTIKPRDPLKVIPFSSSQQLQQQQQTTAADNDKQGEAEQTTKTENHKMGNIISFFFFFLRLLETNFYEHTHII